jgi:signal transduction histidine kinase/CheY-like chemotaxis protein
MNIFGGSMNKKLQFLIVETLSTNSQLLARELNKTKLNFILKNVKSKKAVFREIKNRRPDAIFFDYYIPDIASLEIMNFVMNRFPSIPIIYLLKSEEGGKIKYSDNQAYHKNLKTSSVQIKTALKSSMENRQKDTILNSIEIKLKQYEEQCHTLPTKNTEGTWCYEFEKPVSLDLSEEQQFDFIHKYAFLAECNASFAKKFIAYEPEELIGTPLSKLYDFSDKNIKNYFQAIIHSKYDLQDYESLEIDKKGRNRIFLNNHIGIKDNNFIIGIWGMQRDISQQKNLEEQLYYSKKREPLGKLVSGIAHDFNNILTVINGYAENALLDVAPKSPLHYDMSIILEAGKRAKNLTHQLLAYCRNQMIERKLININKMILNLENMLNQMINHDIIIEKKLANRISLIKTDPVQIEQILINLIINARDALNHKTDFLEKKKIIIETKNTYFNKHYITQHPGIKEGPYVLISIQDNGIGMDKETKKHIFEPFFSTKKKDKGIGMGLTTVYSIVTQNEGYILVNSEKGTGSIFNIYLPCVKNSPTTTSTFIHESTSANLQNLTETVI